MATPAEEVQLLLRFLTQDAKVPLATALPTYPKLRKENLITPEAIANANEQVLSGILGDDKLRKQVVNAAKKVTKNPAKRTLSDKPESGPTKRQRFSAQDSEQETEEKLAFPTCDLSLAELSTKTIETNRAPLFLAFAFCVSKHVLQDHPLSSRLSVAQAVTSAGAQSKARYLGLKQDKTAEEEGWAQGQPKVRLMNRDVSVMRRHVPVTSVVKEEPGSQNTLQNEEADGTVETCEAYWALDLEALKKSNSSHVAGKMHGSVGPPIHRPENARSYLLKSVSFVVDNAASKAESRQGDASSSVVKKPAPSKTQPNKDSAAAALLKCLDYVCESWADSLLPEDLDRKACAWYTNIRPDVSDGQTGWGQRGKVALKDILDLAQSTK